MDFSLHIGSNYYWHENKLHLTFSIADSCPPPLIALCASLARLLCFALLCLLCSASFCSTFACSVLHSSALPYSAFACSALLCSALACFAKFQLLCHTLSSVLLDSAFHVLSVLPCSTFALFCSLARFFLPSRCNILLYSCLLSCSVLIARRLGHQFVWCKPARRYHIFISNMCCLLYCCKLKASRFSNQS